MPTLHQNDRAPDFTAFDVDGRPVRLADYRGHKVLLTFFRYATCPFCTVRFMRLAREAAQYSDRGLRIIGVFESSADYIREYVYLYRRGLPFPVIPDPRGDLYALYGARKSWLGLMLGMFRIPTLMRALFTPTYHMAAPDGSLSRIPADFLIRPDQLITEAYYGNDIGDHIPFRHINRFTEKHITPSQEKSALLLPTAGHNPRIPGSRTYPAAERSSL